MRPMWFFLKQRGHPPSIYLLDTYQDLDQEDRYRLDDAYVKIYDVLTGGSAKIGVKAICPFDTSFSYSGFPCPEKDKIFLFKWLKHNLGEQGIKPSSVNIQ